MMDKNGGAYWFLFSGDKLLLEKDGNTYKIPYIKGHPAAKETSLKFAGCKGTSCMAANIPEENSPEGLEAIPLRQAYDLIPHPWHALAGRAEQMLYWDANSRFCPACGTATELSSPLSKRCPECGKEIFPSISPVAIVLVRKDDSILLVHARNNKYGTMGPVSGFVEPGESLEECAAREVMEETGISVRNVRYVGSQSWPYPSNLMAGFMADYAGGEIRLQEEEIEPGGFFPRDALPLLPPPMSIGRRLIDAWIAESADQKPD